MTLVAETTPARRGRDAGCPGSRGHGGERGQRGSFAWLDDVIARGIRLHGDRLRPADEAKTVLVRDGEIRLSDGPFAETKEIICGYDMLECASLEEASVQSGGRGASGRGLRQDRGQGGVVPVTATAACTCPAQRLDRPAWSRPAAAAALTHPVGAALVAEQELCFAMLNPWWSAIYQCADKTS